ncbi:uncharacterized protein LOC144159555 isoform X2 [Haemaphysalis longicornis]
MPDGNWYRVSGLPTGVNFRATNFRSVVPPARVCSVCRLIPTRLFLLPCSHTVCKSCWDVCFDGASCRGVSCPLDGVHFDVEDCHDISLSPDKVACWNSLHGCEMTGTLAGVLEHFERDCTFHEAICGRCQARVVQSDIADHLRRGCTGNSEPVTRTTQGDSVSSREQRPLNLEGALAKDALKDFKDALAELKILLTTNGSNVVSVLETKVNELTENIRSLEATTLELVGTSRKDGAELCQQLLQAQSELTSWRNSLREGAGSSRTKTKDAFTSTRFSTRTMRTQTDAAVVLDQSEAQKRKCKESAASLNMVSGTRSCSVEVSGAKVGGRDTSRRPMGPLLDSQPAKEVASFITQVERKCTGRSEHRLEFTGWQSFKTRAAETDQHVYATCTVWYSQQLWFRVLLFLETLEENVLHLTAYVKLQGAGTPLATAKVWRPVSTAWGTLKIAHPSKGERDISGNPLNGWRPAGFEHHSNIKSQHYTQFMSVPVNKLEKEGYVAHDTIQFHFVLKGV